MERQERLYHLQRVACIFAVLFAQRKWRTETGYCWEVMKGALKRLCEYVLSFSHFYALTYATHVK